MFETTRGEIIRAMQKSQSSHCRRAPRLVQCSAKSGLHQAAQSAVPVGSVRAGARSSSKELRPADACPAISKTAVKWRAAAAAIVVIEYYGDGVGALAPAVVARADGCLTSTSIDRLLRVRSKTGSLHVTDNPPPSANAKGSRLTSGGTMDTVHDPSRNSYALGLRKHVFDCFLAASSNAIKYQSPLTHSRRTRDSRRHAMHQERKAFASAHEQD